MIQKYGESSLFVQGNGVDFNNKISHSSIVGLNLKEYQTTINLKEVDEGLRSDRLVLNNLP